MRDLPLEVVKKMGTQLKEKQEQIYLKYYNATTKEEKKALIRQLTLVNYQLSSLRYFIDLRLGLLKINLPKNENGLQKLIKRIFRKNKE